MRIGIDIDNTICDTDNYVLPILCEYYNLDIKKIEDCKKNNQYIEFKDYNIFAQKFYYEILPQLKGAKYYINKLKENNEIIFITARKTLGKQKTYSIVKDYLNKNEILFDKIFVNCGDKYKVCLQKNIDIFIDDSINNCRSVSKIRTIDVILFGSKYNKENENLNRIESWENIYNYICEKYK